MNDNMMPIAETTENQGLRLVVNNELPTDCLDSVPADCQQTATEAASVDGILPPYTGKKIQQYLNISERTFYRYLAEIKEVWFWATEEKFRDGKGYSQLALTELQHRNQFPSKDEYVASVHRENGEAIAQFKASQLPATEPAVEPEGELAKVVPVEVVAGLSTLQENLYKVDEFGSSRLALANERLNQTGQNLNLTLDQTREAMRNLAMQQYQSSQADEVERRERLNREYLTAYQEELALIQARNMAREDARMQAQAMEQAIKGKAQAPSDSNAV